MSHLIWSTRRLRPLRRLTWHGIPALPPPQPSPIPSLLGQLLVLGRTHPAVCSRQNRLVDDGLLCFYVENQGVYRWAYRPGGPGPVVVGQSLDEDGWVAEQQRLGGFLLQVCLFEAVFSARYSATAAWLPPAELAAVWSWVGCGRCRPRGGGRRIPPCSTPPMTRSR